VPRRDDLKSILIAGSGPIVIGQACEFDYSGTQACRALKEEGYRVILLNSNPATIMTDPGLADATYVEPITPEAAEAILAKEKPDALLPTLGGQTALNLAVALAKNGALERHGVELIGASLEAIEKAEDREQFKAAMNRIGVEMAQSVYVSSEDEAHAAIEALGLPIILRPSFTLGGAGGGIAWDEKTFLEKVRIALRESPNHTVLLEESIIGWKEYELEVMRDLHDNVVIICSIENLDPMGVHTGDSITVAPAQTLTDREYQRMRDSAIRIIREIGVDTGGCNIQYAVDPKTGRQIVIEMNPRVSRSSALASKATGFPIAKIAARLAVGYRLDELPNDITKETPASFEPVIDYVVTKIPRFTFEKFPGADAVLTTAMKSVGEVMAIGRTFKGSLQKALRSMENGWWGLNRISPQLDRAGLEERVRTPRGDRILWVGQAFRDGLTVDEVHRLSGIDPWFLSKIAEIVRTERWAAGLDPEALEPEGWRRLKGDGFSDRHLAELWQLDEAAVRARRREAGVRPVFKRVDTCAAEFEAMTPYLYSAYERECEADVSDRDKVIILGSGPNRIGQGIEFDYCCVQASFALEEAGIESIMVNCNPETVSTDYDTSDRLYFEPLTQEDVLEVIETERAKGRLLGCIVQFGGQTPLKLAVPLARAGIPILGTSPDAIDRAEDRERFQALLEKLGLRQAPGAVARSVGEAAEVARGIGYPVMVRPSYVLGGRAMEIVHDEESLRRYMAGAVEVSPEHPVLVDRFLKDAIEVDVDVVADGTDCMVAGIMEHIEEAGIHSGDSACALPPHSLSDEIVAELGRQSVAMARELGVRGLMNVQFAIMDGEVYVIEVNPRASRTVPFVGKATGVPIAKIATLVMAGKRLAELGYGDLPGGMLARPGHYSVKEAVFPFKKLPGVDTILGPEMKSTGEVMGIAESFEAAYGKAQEAAGNRLPRAGMAFLSVKEADKPALEDVARRLKSLGFALLATRGTAAFLSERGIACEAVNKVREGSPHCVDRIVGGDVSLVINTTEGKKEIIDSFSIRRETLMNDIPYVTTMSAARAAVGAIEASGEVQVRPLQAYHAAAPPKDG
jgi:carbamoyl-phosphate synthase large subunit